jgi:hypothetical protein
MKVGSIPNFLDKSISGVENYELPATLAPVISLNPSLDILPKSSLFESDKITVRNLWKIINQVREEAQTCGIKLDADEESWQVREKIQEQAGFLRKKALDLYQKILYQDENNPSLFLQLPKINYADFKDDKKSILKQREKKEQFLKAIYESQTVVSFSRLKGHQEIRELMEWWLKNQPLMVFGKKGKIPYPTEELIDVNGKKYLVAENIRLEISDKIMAVFVLGNMARDWQLSTDLELDIMVLARQEIISKIVKAPARCELIVTDESDDETGQTWNEFFLDEEKKPPFEIKKNQPLLYSVV